MSYIGSIDFSGMLNDRPDSTKVSFQEQNKVHQHHIADTQERVRDEKRETIMEPFEAEDARIKDENKGKSDQGRHKKNNEEDDGKESKYIIPTDEDLGQKFDFSA
ncbi:MAG: hypothetical protein DKM50_10155 [Candidatus Margulisiibacteriota bacterium]|nr:MAG: hypothetical protein A2X43_04240 [Candidatus Margulisbacteria bacterium GWD2_39_127]OGI05209.1 MAG: hypothetical protein A2X42_02750 [Candidatus Margulisbacteria bacterium GWF2_38_17]OGI06258.1 MAG: hypothetical protein A2X41_08330 [Candidatus Margulisbacteria bacterium GWE2_39_32]PZM78914.1 MAG: hypothetical protein DKM50_10155 [Candidatus Margulisiibacteriota bacterium]HAR64502.1 hypothetical protein [Candidatus Margulisiibacteriota bacterium]